ncbi:MAG: dipeptidase [Alphaproteobacteria bacterium]|nr:dipeptidase [Alphaproteobacteria bacterium]
MAGINRRAVLVNGTALAVAGPALAAPSPAALHRRLICLDTHLDAPMNFSRAGWDIMQRHGGDIDTTQLDYPRMVRGGLDGGFFAIYTPQGPETPEGFLAMRDAAFLRAAEIREMVAAHPKQFELAFTAKDAARIAAKGKRIVYQSIENSSPLGNDVSLLRVFYRLGVRMAGPIHFKSNQLGDSATDAKRWNGLSPMGKDFVALCNELGIVVDQSHSSDDVFDQMLELSKAPIICSHSGCRAVHDHPRNLDDARIKKLAAAGSTIQINSYNEYLVTVPPNPERQRAQGAIRAAARLPAGATRPQILAAQRKQRAAMKELDRQYPIPRASFEDFMQHVTHALDLVGPDHVGLGPDWDGGGGVTGMEDVASLPKVTERLVKLGYAEAQLAQFWGGNALRVLGAAQAARKA